jgi:isopenicillin N synthase-like dioxygenase
MNEVPVIALPPSGCGDPAERARVRAQIDAACCEIGFFAVTGHGVPGHSIDDLRTCAHEFVSLPLAGKLRSRHPVEGTNRGYHPVGGEALSMANDAVAPPDLEEFLGYSVRSASVTGMRAA